MGDYTILLSRRKGTCIASIPELCISSKAPEPEQALANVILAETEAIERLRSSGLPLPLPADKIDSLSKIHALFKKTMWFFLKVVAAFLILMVLSSTVVTIIYPTINERVKSYILSNTSKEDVHKIMKHLGISICVENKNKPVSP